MIFSFVKWPSHLTPEFSVRSGLVRRFPTILLECSHTKSGQLVISSATYQKTSSKVKPHGLYDLRKTVMTKIGLDHECFEHDCRHPNLDPR
jgi:hypothetical protein